MNPCGNCHPTTHVCQDRQAFESSTLAEWNESRDLAIGVPTGVEEKYDNYFVCYASIFCAQMCAYDLEDEDYVCIESERFSATVPDDDIGWTPCDAYGY